MIKIYNKLIRDKIPEIIKQDNAVAKIRILNDQEYFDELFKKLIEEIKEAEESKDNKKDLTKEIGDAYEVIDALIEHFGLSKDEILDLQKERREKRGGFNQRLFLEETEGGTY